MVYINLLQEIIAHFNKTLFVLILLITLSILIATVLIKKSREFLRFCKKTAAPKTTLELKPYRITEQKAYTTEQLFNVIHSISENNFCSFELVSTKGKGIRYLVRVNTEDADYIKKNLFAYLPDLIIEETDDYLSDMLDKDYSLIEFKLSKHFAFPLKSQETLDKHDPIAYLTGSMTGQKEGELMAFQIVASPLRKNALRDIKRISKLIYSRKDLVVTLNRRDFHYPVLSVFKVSMALVLQVLLIPLGILVFFSSDGKEGPILKISESSPNKKTSNPYQQEMEKMIKDKLDQELFRTSLRLLVISKNSVERSKKARGFSSTLSTFRNSSYQSLAPARKNKPMTFMNWKLFKIRAVNPVTNSILSVSEVSDLYHFPFTKTTRTEDIAKHYSRELPTPLSLKNPAELDVTFAKNTYGGKETSVGLTQDERRRHVYILGATGTGKTTMLFSMINQDIQNNKGICVIDPHGDLIEDILHIIPESRINDVVYFNPYDIEYPMGINLLELSKNTSKENALREKEFVTESVISLFHKLYSERYSGPRMEYILRNTIHTAFSVPDATLFTVYKLLTNTPFRKSAVKTLENEDLKDFWKYEFGKAGDYQKVSMISPITNKIGRFLFSPSAKRILEQKKSTIGFENIMNAEKILLCNLSKGKLGEDNSEVFGVVILTKIQLAALQRAQISQEERKDFYLYVDEFQNFATPSFAQILSEARKYRLNATLAHQTTSQLEDKSLVNVTLANTGTVICFRTANPEDERVILPQFRPYIERGEISNLPSYRFYMKLGALNPEEPFSGTTLLAHFSPNQKRVGEVIESSRKNYATKYVEKPYVRYQIKAKSEKDLKGLLP